MQGTVNLAIYFIAYIGLHFISLDFTLSYTLILKAVATAQQMYT